jgi:nickel transport protein
MTACGNMFWKIRKKRMTCFMKKLVLMMVFCLLGATAAEAHKVTIFAWAEGNTVFTQSKFSGGKRVKNGRVEVLDPAGIRLLEGRTDDNGEFSFKVPTVTDLNIVLTAGMGHQNSWQLSAAELGGALPGQAPTASVSPEAPVSESPQGTVTAGIAVTARDVETIVARQLEQKIQPLTRMLAAMQDRGPTLSNIIGGIGYIMGLVGLAAYLRYRRDTQR